MATITFTNHDTSLNLTNKRALKTFLASIFREEGIEFSSVSYVFCSDEYLLGLNKQYLNHDTYTDILTFSLTDSPLPVAAEIYISTERVQENAPLHHVTIKNELDRVMIHGILHLCGYSDHTPELKTEMTTKEDYYLKKKGST